MCLTPDNLDAKTKEGIQKDLSGAIRVNTRPLTISEWKEQLELQGFVVTDIKTAPMHLLRPKRMLQDEGITGVLRIATNVIRQPKARKRVLMMRKKFMKYEPYLQGVTMIAELPKQ